MSIDDKLLQTVEAVYSASLDANLWPAVLKTVTELVGGVGTTFEVVDKTSMRVTDFWSHGIPAGSDVEYADHFISISPRVVLGFNQHAGDIGYDFMLIDDAGIDRDPYYSDFLGRADMRYFISGTLTRTPQEFACFAVQRSPRQGHIGKREIALMRALTPHMQHAFDISRRLRNTNRMSQEMGHALDWLADGAALLRADGTLLYVNEAMQEIARNGDGIRVVKNQLEFSTAEIGARFAKALMSACGLKRGSVAAESADFPVPRAAGAPPYLVSLRPLPAKGDNGEASAIIFIRDPLQPRRAVAALLREAFAFTAAEADFALALQSGMSPAGYARQQGLSPNTVYTHLRRIKDKTGCKRQGELVRKLGAMQTSVRGGQ
jgi:DNA-binding CsgD family transcriptional regulator